MKKIKWAALSFSVMHTVPFRGTLIHVRDFRYEGVRYREYEHTYKIGVDECINHTTTIYETILDVLNDWILGVLHDFYGHKVSVQYKWKTNLFNQTFPKLENIDTNQLLVEFIYQCRKVHVQLLANPVITRDFSEFLYLLLHPSSELYVKIIRNWNEQAEVDAPMNPTKIEYFSKL